LRAYVLNADDLAVIIEEQSGSPGAVTILDREWSVIATMFVIALAGIGPASRRAAWDTDRADRLPAGHR
jgi:hypothetical protein